MKRIKIFSTFYLVLAFLSPIKVNGSEKSENIVFEDQNPSSNKMFNEFILMVKEIGLCKSPPMSPIVGCSLLPSAPDQNDDYYARFQSWTNDYGLMADNTKIQLNEENAGLVMFSNIYMGGSIKNNCEDAKYDLQIKICEIVKFSPKVFSRQQISSMNASEFFFVLLISLNANGLEHTHYKIKYLFEKEFNESIIKSKKYNSDVFIEFFCMINKQSCDSEFIINIKQFPIFKIYEMYINMVAAEYMYNLIINNKKICSFFHENKMIKISNMMELSIRFYLINIRKEIEKMITMESVKFDNCISGNF